MDSVEFFSSVFDSDSLVVLFTIVIIIARLNMKQAAVTVKAIRAEAAAAVFRLKGEDVLFPRRCG